MNPPASTSIPLALSQRRAWAADQSISFLMQQGLENRDLISLAAGFVDEATLPVELVRDAMQTILDHEQLGQAALQYAATTGDPLLRELFLEHLARLEGGTTDSLGISTDQLVVTSGSQQFLHHVCDLLFDPGDICLVAAPTYFVFLGTLNGVGARTIAIESDGDGMRMDCLEEQLKSLEQAGDLHKVKLIYLVSSFENPSGTTLAEDRREQVVEIAKRWSNEHRILILEDAAYRELRYEGDDPASIWGFDAEHEHVMLAQTFSKSFSPGIRMAYGIIPRDLIQAMQDIKGNFDFGSPSITQQILAQSLQSDDYPAHVAKLHASYILKRDAMLSAAEKYFSDIPGCSWLRPQGGLYVWLTLPEEIDTGYAGDLFHQATKTQGVMYVPGSISYPPDSPLQRHNEMRLSFGVESPETIDQGMRRLSLAVKSVR
jgi:2-aminoadipate transaminase